MKRKLSEVVAQPEAEEEEEEMSSEEEDEDVDTDEELQEAFASGLLKPGLHTMQKQRPKKQKINNVPMMKQKLGELQLRLPWLERLDMVNKPAPLAPELAYEQDQHEKKRAKELKAAKKPSGSLADDDVHNDFKREMIFYRQAQAAVLEALPRLKSMGIKTKRPDDYFAQMAKTDDHMQRVREKLVSKQVTEERREKIRKLRDLRKHGKKVQAQVNVKKQQDKKEMLDQVKKFRKGEADQIDFLRDDDGQDDAMADGPYMKKKKKKQGQNGAGGHDEDMGDEREEKQRKRTALFKRKTKDKKFGFGGKKRGLKSNTKDSVNDVDSYRPFKKAPAMAQKLKAKRQGKTRRSQMKGRGQAKGKGGGKRGKK